MRRSVVTCTGTEFCKLAITETRGRGREIVEYLEQRVPLEEPMRIHITGCSNSCAQMQIGNIGMMGAKMKVDGVLVDAYEFFIGGQLGQGMSFNDRDEFGKRRKSLAKIPASDCKVRIEHLLMGYKKQRKPGEKFNDFCRRVGDDVVTKLLVEEEKSRVAVEDVASPPVPEVDGPVH